MTLIADGQWEIGYQSDGTDLIRAFYEPVLEDAVRYDRLTGYFDARALTLAVRGVEGLVRNDGRMRLIVGCTLNEEEVAAIERGEQLRDRIWKKLESISLQPFSAVSRDALALLAWMIAKNILEIRVAVPCDDNGNPTTSCAIFHAKSGIVEDRFGDKIAWNGSLNETESGWRHNWEKFDVYVGKRYPEFVTKYEREFADIWEGRERRLLVMGVPDAVRDQLLQFLPDDDQPPAPLKNRKTAANGYNEAELAPLVWSYIRAAAMRPYGGQRVGEATAAFSPWPHQVSAFSRLYGKWPPRLLIADEVGLGKTIQAGMLLRQAVLSGRVRRVLILAPKAVLKQWQLELREKFNLYWPIYDGKHLTWCPCPAYPSGRTVEVDDERWHEEPFVIAGSQLVRLKPRARVLIEQAREWDLILLDEAHHARRKGAGGTTDKGPNALLRLMQKLAIKTQGLVLMTATPMQVHPKEVWDLMNLLGLPPSWDEASFLSFFEKLGKEDISFDKFDSCVQLFRDAERMYGETTDAEAATLSGLSKFKARKWVRLLRGESREPIRQIFSENRSAVVQLVQRSSPIRRLISRHTRDLLRRYFQEGKIRTPIAQRQVQDVFIDMKPEERYLYEEVEEYITSSYRVASTEEKQAVGFIMTIYRRRLASSFEALRQTLLRHRVNIDTEEDGPDEDAPDESMEGIDTDRIEKAAQKIQEQGEIDLLLTQLDRLPLDSKCERLLEVLHEVQAAGYEQVMIFTQYADTLDFLRKKLVTSGVGKILCFSGRGGEILDTDGSWKEVSRDETKRRFREGLADIMLCTDAAAEGLNFQFCGALINYDMPWNPMRVEQRIGRIDRLGQLKSRIRIVNLHYQDTVETDIYHVLRQRIRLFENFVGKLQPILSRLSGRITSAVLSGAGANPETRQMMLDQIQQEVSEAEESGFDLDDAACADLELPDQPLPSLTLEDLHRVLKNPALMPPEAKVEPLSVSRREFALWMMGFPRVRVTTDPHFYGDNAESVELWSPGSPVFMGLAEDLPPPPSDATLGQLLDRLGV